MSLSGPMRQATCGLLAAFTLLAACEREVILPGERFAVRTPLDASVGVEVQPSPVAPPDDPQNTVRPIGLPAMVANAEWTQRGGNAQHAVIHGSLSATPQLIWVAEIGAGNAERHRITAAPVVSGGLVFAMDALAQLTAVSLSGATLWRADLTAPYDRGGAQSGGGIAVAGGLVIASTGYGEVVALEAGTGAMVWRQRLGAPAVGAPGVAGGVVYVMSADGTAWALDTASGRVNWTLPAVKNQLASDTGAAPAVAGDMVIFPFSAGVMLAAGVDEGAAKWQAAITGNRLGRAFANSGDITGDPVIAGGVVYVGTAAGRTGAFRDDSGERIWTAEDGAVNPALVVGGSMFMVSDEGRLIRLDAGTGQRIWATDLPEFVEKKPRNYGKIYAHFGPVLAGGRLVTVSSDGLLRQYDPASGAVVGSVAVPGGAASMPALAGGMMFVVTARGQLLAFR